MEERIKWYRTPIDRELLKQLNKRSDARGLLQAGSMLIIFALTVYASWYFFARGAWLATAAACYIHCMLHGFAGMDASAHELSHGTPFKTRWLNEFFYHLFCFLTWNNGPHFRISHTRHHQLTLHRGRDKEVVLEPVPFNGIDWLSWFTFDFKKFWMYVIPNFAYAFGRTGLDFFHWDPLLPRDDAQMKKVFNFSRFIVIGHLILLGLFIYFKLWPLIVVITFGYFIATFPVRGCVAQQHVGLCSNIPDWRVSAYTMEYGTVLGYLYWHMNYHVEHHTYAAVPFYNLRKLHQAMAHNTAEPPKGWIGGWKRILSIQREQGKNPEFCFVATLPPTAEPAHMTEA
jgi:fatty acid desaturase